MKLSSLAVRRLGDIEFMRLARKRLGRPIVQASCRMSVDDVALRIGTEPRHLIELVADGLLIAEWERGVYFIDLVEFDDYLANIIDRHEWRNGRSRPPERGTCGVYFLRCGDFVKIGISERVQSRLRCLRTGNPYPVELLCVVETKDPAALEERLHQRFEQYRHRDEWFRDVDEIRAYIETARKPA